MACVQSSVSYIYRVGVLKFSVLISQNKLTAYGRLFTFFAGPEILRLLLHSYFYS